MCATRPVGGKKEGQASPKRPRKGAPGEQVACTVLPAPFDLGFALLAATPRGLCAVLLGNNPEELRAELQHRFRAAILHEDPSLAALAGQIFAPIQAPEPGSPAERSLELDPRPTAFQALVWAALRTIPRGETRTYSQIAAQLDKPTAARAVARACAVNPLALVIPCHRAVGKSGALTGYRWGLERKEKLLAAESILL